MSRQYGVNMGSSIVTHTLKSLEVLVLGESPPTKQDWDAHCAYITQTVAAGRLPKYIIAVTEGGGPNAAQRQQLVNVLPKGFRPERMAVCSSSMVTRGILTALAWLGLDGTKSFQFDELYEAWSWVGPPGVSFAELEAVVVRAQTENGWRRVPKKSRDAARV